MRTEKHWKKRLDNLLGKEFECKERGGHLHVKQLVEQIRLEVIEWLFDQEFVTGSIWLADLWLEYKDSTEVRFRLPKHLLAEMKDNINSENE